VRKSGRHKLQGAVIVDQTQTGTDTQLREEKEQWRRQLQISSNPRYYGISSMQNTSKLLQHACVQSQKWSIYLDKSVTPCCLPQRSSAQQWDCASQSLLETMIWPPLTAVVCTSGAAKGKGPADTAEGPGSWGCHPQGQGLEKITETEFNIFLETPTIGSAACMNDSFIYPVSKITTGNITFVSRCFSATVFIAAINDDEMCFPKKCH